MFPICSTVSIVSSDPFFPFTYAFDPSGNITGRSLDNGTATAFTVDQVNRDTSVEHKKGANMVKQFDYAYNEVNDVTTVVRDQNVNDSDGYKYDLTQQIVEFQQTGHFDSSTGMVTNPAKRGTKGVRANY